MTLASAGTVAFLAWAALAEPSAEPEANDDPTVEEWQGQLLSGGYRYDEEGVPGRRVEVVVDGETGLLVPPLDPPALARAAQAILQDPERQRAMGEAARRRAVEHFGMTAALDRYEALYRRCMGG